MDSSNGSGIVQAKTLATWKNFTATHFFRVKKSKVLSLHVYTAKCAQVSVVYTQPEVS